MKGNIKFILIGFVLGIAIMLLAGIIPVLFKEKPPAAQEEETQVSVRQEDESGTQIEQPADSASMNTAEFFDRGLKTAASGEYRESMSYFKKVLEKDPGNSGAHKELGKIYIELDDIENADKHIKKAEKLDPENKDIMFQHARVKNAREDYAGALEILEYLIDTLESGDEGIYLYSMLLAADIYIITGEKEKAARLARRSLEIFPESTWARRVLLRAEE